MKSVQEQHSAFGRVRGMRLQLHFYEQYLLLRTSALYMSHSSFNSLALLRAHLGAPRNLPCAKLTSNSCCTCLVQESSDGRLSSCNGLLMTVPPYPLHEKISLGSNLNVPPLQQLMTFCPLHHGSGEQFIFLPARLYLHTVVTLLSLLFLRGIDPVNLIYESLYLRTPLEEQASSYSASKTKVVKLSS